MNNYFFFDLDASFNYSDFTGYISLFLIIFLLPFLIHKKPHIKNILILFVFIRIILSIVNVDFISLPDSRGDAKKFILIAAEISKEGFYENLINPNVGEFFKYSYPWILSLFFSLFGVSYLLACTINIIFGMLTIFFLDSFLKLLWGNFSFNKRIFYISLIPSIILYSIIPLREALFVFFLLIAFLNLGYFLKFNKIVYLILTLIFFFMTGFMHGGGYIGLIIILLFLTISNFKHFINKLINNKINFINILILSFTIILLFNYFSGDIVFSKIGSYSNLIDFNYIASFSTNRSFGDAKYPNFLIPSKNEDLIWIIPVKFIYFLFGPFPWDVKSPIQLVGLFQSIIYVYIFYKIFSSFKIIKYNKFAYLIFICIIIYLLAFSIGTSNFGTGYRHKAKFIIFLASLLPLFTNKKIKKNKY